MEADTSERTDVLVIGAGISGLLLASELRRRHLNVVVLESGAAEQVEETHPLNEVVHLAEKFHGAMRGRFRCLGGTSTRWGGALLPFLEQDLRDRPGLGLRGWPIGLDELLPHLPRIEGLFSVDGGAYDEALVSDLGAQRDIPVGDQDFILRFAKWPVFKRRNFAILFRAVIQGDRGLRIWINATATAFDIDRETRRLRMVTARHLGGRSLTVMSTETVVCAGAIESTRLLLLADRQSEGRMFQGCSAIGRYLNDHISLPVAELRPLRPSKLNSIAGFRFVGTTMRSLRFELAPSAQAREAAGSAFGHISFTALRPSGFAALRDLLRIWQKTGQFRTSLAFATLADARYLMRAADWRFRRHQLYWPDPASYYLHVVAEQLPDERNRISLADSKDPFGQPMAAIEWRKREGEIRTLVAFQRCFAAYWSRHELLHEAAELCWLCNADNLTHEHLSAASDIFHPCSSTRMGIQASESVVDADLKVHDVPNLAVASTSVFPSGASANPTLMLMLLTLRLADRLCKRFALGRHAP
jgi:choline dehydrogenase-like flavoprotein